MICISRETFLLKMKQNTNLTPELNVPLMTLAFHDINIITKVSSNGNPVDPGAI